MSPVNEAAVEQVLVIPTAVFHDLGYFQGVCTNVEPYLARLFDAAHVSYRPRDVMETDPGFKQLIPYCLFRWQGQLFHYTRGKLQGEGRLRGKRSVGVGGHISSTDQSHRGSPYLDAMHREIEEEVYLETPYRDRLVALLNDDQTEVGKVHLGIVHVFDLEEPKVRPREASMLDAGFAPAEELLRDLDGFETWSQLCLSHLTAS
ncbi:MAG: phosphoesterase [Planctomycetaceae bacterium]|nr:MAG: phosphoesterase [Planctomycetaceae bacterium]